MGREQVDRVQARLLLNGSREWQARMMSWPRKTLRARTPKSSPPRQPAQSELQACPLHPRAQPNGRSPSSKRRSGAAPRTKRMLQRRLRMRTHHRTPRSLLQHEEGLKPCRPKPLTREALRGGPSSYSSIGRSWIERCIGRHRTGEQARCNRRAPQYLCLCSSASTASASMSTWRCRQAKRGLLPQNMAGRVLARRRQRKTRTSPPSNASTILNRKPATSTTRWTPSRTS